MGNFPADYADKNKELWNAKLNHHLGSSFYDLEGFKAGKTSLRHVELSGVGEVHGKSLLHLQCHFGQDTLSWARRGARVVGVDLSDKAIETAGQLALELDLPAQFIACNLYDLPQHLEGQFDWVFTSYGTIGWLPDLDKWAELVAAYLKPGGSFYMVDFHPVIWMFDDDFEAFAYSYFNEEPIITEPNGTYADREADLVQHQEISWNHSLGELLGALLGAGLNIAEFKEYPYSTWPCFKEMTQVGEESWVISRLGKKVPHMYSICCQKPV